MEQPRARAREKFHQSMPLPPLFTQANKSKKAKDAEAVTVNPEESSSGKKKKKKKKNKDTPSSGSGGDAVANASAAAAAAGGAATGAGTKVPAGQSLVAFSACCVHSAEGFRSSNVVKCLGMRNLDTGGVFAGAMLKLDLCLSTRVLRKLEESYIASHTVRPAKAQSVQKPHSRIERDYVTLAFPSPRFLYRHPHNTHTRIYPSAKRCTWRG